MCASLASSRGVRPTLWFIYQQTVAVTVGTQCALQCMDFYIISKSGHLWDREGGTGWCFGGRGGAHLKGGVQVSALVHLSGVPGQ